MKQLARQIKRRLGLSKPIYPLHWNPAWQKGSDIYQAATFLRNADPERAWEILQRLKKSDERVEDLDYLRGYYFIEHKKLPSAHEAFKEELRYFPKNDRAKDLLGRMRPGWLKLPENVDPEFLELYGVIKNYTMVTPLKLISLFDLAKRVCQQDIPGNFIECGVAAGGSSALLAAVIVRYSKRPRLLFSCDTFTGMPDPTPEDVHEGVDAEATGWGKHTCAAPEQSLIEAATKLKAAQVIRPLKGLFSETLPKHRNEIGQIALLHMDGDWYSSTMDVLVNLYEQLSPSTPVQVDDYVFWEGCRRAIEEFEQKRGFKFKVHKIGEEGVWLEPPAVR